MAIIENTMPTSSNKVSSLDTTIQLISGSEESKFRITWFVYVSVRGQMLVLLTTLKFRG